MDAKTRKQRVARFIHIERAIVSAWCSYMLVLWLIAIFSHSMMGSMGGM